MLNQLYAQKCTNVDYEVTQNLMHILSVCGTSACLHVWRLKVIIKTCS